MRRISAILLLVAFSLPLIAAAFQDSDASLPACCRRAGIHHCGGMVQGDSGSTNGPSLKSGACAEFPTTASVGAFLRIAPPVAARTLAAPDSRLSDAPLGNQVRVTAGSGDSHPQRGPPSLLS
jgi:hypothetical protein